MIKIFITFPRSIDFAQFIEHLDELPEEVRPDYFSIHENRVNKHNTMDKFPEKYLKRFEDDKEAVLFLKQKKKNLKCVKHFFISFFGDDYTDLDLSLVSGTSPELVQQVIEHFARFNPVFGYACEDEELDHRNIHMIEIFDMTSRSSVGRDIKKQVPGLYWLTLLSKPFLKKHGVKVENLQQATIELQEMNCGQCYLLKFFANPKDWKQNAERLDGLCFSTDKVFSIRLVEEALRTKDISTYLKFEEVMSEF